MVFGRNGDHVLSTCFDGEGHAPALRAQNILESRMRMFAKVDFRDKTMLAHKDKSIDDRRIFTGKDVNELTLGDLRALEHREQDRDPEFESH